MRLCAPPAPGSRSDGRPTTLSPAPTCPIPDPDPSDSRPPTPLLLRRLSFASRTLSTKRTRIFGLKASLSGILSSSKVHRCEDQICKPLVKPCRPGAPRGSRNRRSNPPAPQQGPEGTSGASEGRSGPVWVGPETSRSDSYNRGRWGRPPTRKFLVK